MTTPPSPRPTRNQLPLEQKFALLAFIKKHREALSNPTTETYRSLEGWAQLASLELNVPIHYSTLTRYAEAANIPLNPSLRRSIASTKAVRPNINTSGLTPLPKYAAICDHINRLETRVAFLESQLGVSTAAH